MEAIVLTRAQVREVDRIAIHEYGIPGVVLMENAGRNAAEEIGRLLADSPRRAAARAAVVCGAGNNGGDGLVIARHLVNGGFVVEIFLACDPDRLSGEAAVNFGIVRHMQIPIARCDTGEQIAATRSRLDSCDVVVDALLGTGFTGQVRAPMDAMIDAINAASHPVIVAIDVPSGLNCDTGLPGGVCVCADLTITFVARKPGFEAAKQFTGEVRVADIGAPVSIVRAVLKR